MLKMQMTKNPNTERKNNKKDNYNGKQRESNQKKKKTHSILKHKIST